jgi:hypothetical protein
VQHVHQMHMCIEYFSNKKVYILNDELRKSIDLDDERGTCSCKNNQITREVRSNSSPIKDRSQHNGSEN